MKSDTYRAVERLMNLKCDIGYGKLQICDLGNHIQGRGVLDRRYQVTSDDSRFLFSEIYIKPAVAIDKFIAIRNFLETKNANNI
jgi:hypothetical protein